MEKEVDLKEPLKNIFQERNQLIKKKGITQTYYFSSIQQFLNLKCIA